MYVPYPLAEVVAVDTAVKLFGVLSTSVSLSVPVEVGVPTPFPAPASTTVPVELPEIIAASFEPVIVTSIVWLAVLSNELTTSVSWTIWPAVRWSARPWSSV